MAANTASQGSLSFPVQQVAAAQQLGTFIKTYKSSVMQAVVGSSLFFVGAVFFCGGFVSQVTSNISTAMILLVFTLFFLGAALSMIYSVIRVVKQRIHLFQQGIVLENGSKIQAIPWKQVSEVWQSITRRYRGRSHVGTIYIYTLRRTDGYQVKLNNLTKDIGELGPIVAKGIVQELMPRAMYGIRAGETLTFAQFSINREGISYKGEFLSWSQVQAVNVSNGWVFVMKVGKPAWRAVRIAKIPNFFVFVRAAEEMVRQSHS